VRKPAQQPPPGPSARRLWPFYDRTCLAGDSRGPCGRPPRWLPLLHSKHSSPRYLEQVEDARRLLEGVRLAELLQLGQRGLEVAVGTQPDGQRHALMEPGDGPVRAATGGHNRSSRDRLRLRSRGVWRYLSLDGVAVPRREEDFLQLLLHQLLVATPLQSRSYTSIQETLERGTCLLSTICTPAY